MPLSKDQKRANVKAYYAKNKDDINRKKREKYKNNIDYRRRYDKNHKAKHSEKHKEQARAYYQKNKERHSLVNKLYREKNRDKLKTKVKEWARLNPDIVKSYVLKKNYGISIVDYNSMFEQQGGRCAICRTHQSDLKKSLHVDHCHESKKVRGLLCVRCNNALGLFDDDIGKLKAAINYLSLFGA